MKNKTKNYGFTLIELLVVISIIGFMAAVVLIAVNGARTKSRDSRRIADVQQIFKALELHYANTGSLPTCSTYSDCDFSDPNFTGSADSTQNGKFTPFLSSYISSKIKDPINKYPYLYYYQANARYPPGTGPVYLFIVGTVLEQSLPPLGSLPATVPGYERAYILGERR